MELSRETQLPHSFWNITSEYEIHIFSALLCSYLRQVFLPMQENKKRLFYQDPCYNM